MPSAGTPYSLYSAYRNIKVPIFGSHMLLGLDVHEYRNNEEGDGYSTVDGLKVYDKMKNLIPQYGERIAAGKYWVYYPLMKNSERKKNPDAPITDYVEVKMGYELYNVFVGKGSPEDITTTLQVAVALGLVDGNVAAMQRFCDVNIGIDCSGFASNYFGLDAKSISGLGASEMAPPAKRVKRLEDVRAGTAIVFKSGKHVALVDKILSIDRTDNTAYAMNCMVAESTADKMVEGGPSDGLNYTEYVLLVMNDKYDPSLFNIIRPYQKKSIRPGEKNDGFYEVKVHLANWPEHDFWD